jgi:protein CpxP
VAIGFTSNGLNVEKERRSKGGKMPRSLTKAAVGVGALALVAALAVTTTLLAQPGHSGPGGRMHGEHGGWGFGFGPETFRELDLTDAQRTQIRTLWDEHRDEIRAAADKLGAAWRAQEEAVKAVPADEAQIRTRGEELGTAQTEMALAHSRLYTAMVQVLTAEQQAKLKQLQTEHRQRMQERRQQWQQRRQEGQQQKQPQGEQ